MNYPPFALRPFSLPEIPMQNTRLAEFGRIDQTNDPNYFIRFLDEACAQASFRAYKDGLIAGLEIKPGSQILDVGCGTGDDVREMARLVGMGGRVVGVDNSQSMIAEAKKRSEGLDLPIEFHLAEALALPFDSGTFDGCRIDRSLMHTPDARGTLAEMIRVTRPAGRVAIYEVDFETLIIDADDRSLARRIAHTWCDNFRNGWLGRRVPRLVRELGLQDISVVPYTLLLTPSLAIPLLGPATTERAIALGNITAAEGQAWLSHLDELQREGRFFSTLSGFLVVGHT